MKLSSHLKRNIVLQFIIKSNLFKINDDPAKNIIEIHDRKKGQLFQGNLKVKFFGCSQLIKSCVVEQCELISFNQKCKFKINIDKNTFRIAKDHRFSDYYILNTTFSINQIERKHTKYYIALKCKFCYFNSFSIFYIYTEPLFFTRDAHHNWYFDGLTLWQSCFDERDKLQCCNLLETLICPYIENLTGGQIDEEQKHYLHSLITQKLNCSDGHGYLEK